MKFIIQTLPRCHLIVHFLPIQVIFTTHKPWTLLSNIFSTDSIWVKDFSLSFLRFFISSSIQFFLNFIALDPFQVVPLENFNKKHPRKARHHIFPYRIFSFSRSFLFKILILFFLLSFLY